MAPDGAEMPRDGSVASASSSALNQPELEYQGGYLKAPATEGGLKFVAGDSRQQAGPLPASARIDASQPWFRGDMSKKDSRALFARDSVQPGDFLVRKSKVSTTRSPPSPLVEIHCSTAVKGDVSAAAGS